MLTELRIKNFAIIESLTLPLSPGFNVLSGETGAGKSIIVGALGFLLGERGSADLIRTGSDKATVEGVFDVADSKAIEAIADERGVDLEDEVLVLKREISSAGRGRAWANGSPVTATVLGEIGRMLVNLHGQHEAQALLDSESQREILDEFGGAASQALVVRDAHTELASVRREIASITSRRADAERRADYLRHVVREIEEARPTAGEDSRLEDEARVLENADELKTIAESVSAMLAEEEGAIEGGKKTRKGSRLIVARAWHDWRKIFRRARPETDHRRARSRRCRISRGAQCRSRCSTSRSRRVRR